MHADVCKIPVQVDSYESVSVSMQDQNVAKDERLTAVQSQLQQLQVSPGFTGVDG